MICKGCVCYRVGENKTTPGEMGLCCDFFSLLTAQRVSSGYLHECLN